MREWNWEKNIYVYVCDYVEIKEILVVKILREKKYWFLIVWAAGLLLAWIKGVVL